MEIDAKELEELRRRSAALDDVIDTLWDKDGNDWRELQSCADAIDSISQAVGPFTPEDDGERTECNGCGESWNISESDAYERGRYCSAACEASDT